MDQLVVPHLTIYSRPGCHLCDDMKRVVAQVTAHMQSNAIVVTEIDISTDEALERMYGQEIPVLFVDGHKSAKYRISEAELRRKLAADT
jgi:glutaredoxin